jgi:hypothetical protein
MRFKITGRQRGKTTQVLEWLCRNPEGVIITFSEGRAADLRKQFLLKNADNALGQISMSEMKRHIRTVRNAYSATGMEPTFYAVDDLDLMLHQLLGLGPQDTLDLLTATGVNSE